MNRKMVFNTLGRMSLACAACLMLPAIVSLIYGEHKSMQAFVVVSAGAAAPPCAKASATSPKPWTPAV